MTASDHRSDDQPLFLDDEALRDRVNPKIGLERFKALLRALEKQHPDFPKAKPLWGGRYWRAVLAWLDADNGVGFNATDTSDIAQDGQENFDAAPKRPPRVQARSPRPPVLDGEPDPRQDAGRIPRRLHPITGGRK